MGTLEPDMLDVKSTVFIDEIESLRGEELFEWKTSERGVTHGIWAYSKPFVLTSRTKSGSETPVAVVLLDTQGLFDVGIHEQCDIRTFGLSMSLASHQILNVSTNIDSQLIERLRLFSAFANDVSTEVNKIDEVEGGNLQRFQTLQFLMRDFQNFESDLDKMAPDEAAEWTRYIKECEAKSKSYIDLVLDSVEGVRPGIKKQLLSNYENLCCQCLPHPGLAVPNGRWKGNPEEIELAFRVLTAGYCSKLFSPENLQPKRDLGSIVEISTFAEHLNDNVEMINKTGASYDVSDQVGLLAHNKVLKASNQVRKKFKTLLIQKCGGVDYEKHYIEAAKFNKCVPETASEVLKEFANLVTKAMRMKLGEQRLEAIQELHESIRAEIMGQTDPKKGIVDGLIDKVIRDNDNKADKLLNWLAPYMAVMIVLYVVDWVSDYVCDPFLGVCVSASYLMNRVYVLIFFGIVIAGGWVFKDHGQHKVFKVMMGLVTATMELIQEKITQLQDFYQAMMPQQESATAKAGKSSESKKHD